MFQAYQNNKDPMSPMKKIDADRSPSSGNQNDSNESPN